VLQLQCGVAIKYDIKETMKKSIKGFTLVELLIVLAIVAIISMLGVTNYIQQQKKARDARRQSDLEQVKAALEMYKVDNTDYPTYADPAEGLDNYTYMVSDLKTAGFLKQDIQDPYSSAVGYAYVSDGDTYKMCAKMETSDPETCESVWGFTAPYNDDKEYGFTNP
jgi:general secretion pathway protein G